MGTWTFLVVLLASNLGWATSMTDQLEQCVISEIEATSTSTLDSGNNHSTISANCVDVVMPSGIVLALGKIEQYEICNFNRTDILNISAQAQIANRKVSFFRSHDQKCLSGIKLSN